MDLNIFKQNLPPVIIELTPRNDFDWSEESLSPGAGWGEYVEEYEVSDTFFVHFSLTDGFEK